MSDGFTAYGEYDAVGLAALIASGKVTADEVLAAALSRIAALNPRLNAVVHVAEDAARQALADGVPAGPLAGVPYLIKDLFLLCDGQPTWSGCRLFDGFVADHDATLVERLRAAGLVLIGKANSAEFGLNATTEPVLFGATRNPWNEERSAGGSSGGSAAAVSAGIVPAAHATDGGGSIRIPASCCGLFGLKPSRGRNPYGPDVGEGLAGLSMAHAVTHSVRDSAALLDATHGPAPGDPYAAPPPARPFSDEVGADPGRLRIALSTVSPIGTPVAAACVAAARDAAKLCTDLGHIVEEATPAIDGESLVDGWRVVAGTNARNVVDGRLAALGRAQRADDVEPITALWIEEAKGRSSTDYLRAIADLHRIGRRLGAFFEDYDLLLTPTLGGPPPPLGTLDMQGDDLDLYVEKLFTFIPFTAQFNASGGPAMSVPLAWTDDGLPVGVHFGARLGDEATLFRLAAQLEAARPWRDRRPALD
ncbi:MAG: amidase [Alphaproteobacteria bacterium]|nr:amidase [Alphaproteobacteria bacterium]